MMSNDNEVVMMQCQECAVDLDESRDDVLYSGDSDEPYCLECYNEEYTSCYECSTETLRIDSYHSEYTTEQYCRECYDEQHMECYNCSRTLHSDEVHWDDEDEPHCEDCYEEVCSSSDEVDWNVYDNQFVKYDDTFVSPGKDGYDKDTFNQITSRRYVGVEVEFNTMDDVYIRDIQDEVNFAIKNSRKNDRLMPTWDKVVTDGSVTDSSHPHGGELVMSPRRGDMFLHDIDVATNTLKNVADAYVSVRCGLHLHIDVRDYDWYHFHVLTLMTKLIEPNIFSFLPPSRREGRWSRPVSQAVQSFQYVDDRDSFIEFYYDGNSYDDEKYHDKRYHGLNLHCHFQANQGLEIRYHSGTMSTEKLKHWTIFWTNVVDVCYDIAERMKSEQLTEYKDFSTTSLWKSIMSKDIKKFGSRFDNIKEKYRVMKTSYVDGDYFNLDEYQKDSELLRRYLSLPKQVGKVYHVESMVKFILERHERTVMSISSMFELFNIPGDTRKYFVDRRNKFKDRNSSDDYNHLVNCYRRKDAIVKFDTDSLKFKFIGCAEVIATIDRASILDNQSESPYEQSYTYCLNGHNIDDEMWNNYIS